MSYRQLFFMGVLCYGFCAMIVYGGSETTVDLLRNAAMMWCLLSLIFVGALAVAAWKGEEIRVGKRYAMKSWRDFFNP